MKRYLVFSCAQFYPAGGWHDFESDFADLDKAKEFATTLYKNDFCDTHIVDTDTGEIVE